MKPTSLSPSGESFALPEAGDYAVELKRIEALVQQAREKNQEIVVVMGLGFVGAVMAAIVADTKGPGGKPSKFVIGCQRPSTRSFWKIPMINRGEAPVKAEDPEVDVLIRRCVLDQKTLVATYNSDVLQFASCVVVDVQCDFAKKELGNMRTGEADMAALEDTMRTIGEKIPPDCLVLIETTVAPGTTEFVAWPILKKEFARRGLIGNGASHAPPLAPGTPDGTGALHAPPLAPGTPDGNGALHAPPSAAGTTGASGGGAYHAPPLAPGTTGGNGATHAPPLAPGTADGTGASHAPPLAPGTADGTGALHAPPLAPGTADGTGALHAPPLAPGTPDGTGALHAPLLAHSFERVMPGKQYVASIRDFWRVCAGCNDEARIRVEKFLHEVLNTRDYPLTVMDRPIESETTKIVENSYRATILAYLNEWSLFAERNGVDLIKVINAIRMRPTHSNMIFPGPGIGGYCLPKDGGLGYWSYKHILGFEDGDKLFRITPAAIDINDTRALHVAELTRDALRNMGRYIAGARVLLCGASYRQDVGDTRYSGSELVVRKLTEMSAEIHVHDPYVDHWYELEEQDTYPSPGSSWKRFFRNQEHLKQVVVEKDLPKALSGVEAVILAVPHAHYLNLDPDDIVQWAGGPLAVIDAFGILTDPQIRRYFQLGCEVKALGRGHLARIKREVKEK